METRTCAKCGETKPLSDFHSDASQPLGREYHCRSCKNKASRDWKKRNPEKNRAQAARWRAKNPEKHRASARASYYRNRDRAQAKNREWRKANLAKSNDYSLKYRLGLPAGTYAEMFAKQDGKCAICGTTDPGRKNGKRLYVDHCHDTGIVRGLLCHGCNSGIAQLKHSEEVLLSAIEYLRISRRSARRRTRTRSGP